MVLLCRAKTIKRLKRRHRRKSLSLWVQQKNLRFDAKIMIHKKILISSTSTNFKPFALQKTPSEVLMIISKTRNSSKSDQLLASCSCLSSPHGPHRAATGKGCRQRLCVLLRGRGPCSCPSKQAEGHKDVG